jgi:small subunit ribosomal protein S3
LRADIDYATSRAETTYGTIGVKVWIFKGEILDGMDPQEENKGAPKRQRATKG